MPRTEIKIRPACGNDIDDLTNLLKALFTLEKDFTFNATKQGRGLQLMLEDSRSCIMVAQANNSVVGMCSGQVILSTAEGYPALLVEDVVVDKRWRGQGIGRKLLDTISRWGEDFKAYRLQLLCDRHNGDALRFYARLGWEETQLICIRKRQKR